MEDQMKFAFMQGGMATDGMEEDPVSGNEIPPGSMAEEVRDDVPVNVSEGEYIIPADVAQFYGMEKLEKMVFKAKEKLAEMEATGRMGDTGEDDLPLSDEELEVMDDPEAPEAEMTAEDMEAKGFAQGGMPTSSFDPAQYAYGGGSGQQTFNQGNQPFNPADYSYGGGSGAETMGNMELKSYVNKDGRIISVHFTDGKPTLGKIPEGFVPNTPEGKKSFQSQAPSNTTADLSAQTPDTVGQNKEDSPNNQRKAGEGYEPKDYSGMSNEDLMKTATNSQMRDFASSATGLLGLVGTPGLGLLAKAGVEAMQNRNTLGMRQELAARLEAGTIGQDAYSEAIGSLDKEMNNFDKLMNNFFPGKEVTPTTTPTQTQSALQAGYSPKRVNATVRDPGTGKDRQSAAPTSSARPKARPTGGGSGSSSVGGTSGGADSRDSSPGQDRAKGGLIKSNYKQGGLVKKR